MIARHLQHFLDTFRKIMETPTGDAETERMKDKWYREMDSVRDRFRSVANCWLAPYFGVPVTLGQCQRAVRTLRDSDAEWQALQAEKWFQDVQSVAYQKRFFHWELEFPEMFFDAHRFKMKEKRGFDAVIGNPPYVEARQLIQEEVDYLRNCYRSIGNRANIFSAFIEKGVSNISSQGRLGVIIHRNIIRSNDHRNVRAFILESCKISHLVSLGSAVFDNVTGEMVILILAKENDVKLRNSNEIRIEIGRAHV